MDKYYGNVCELDIIFSFTKAYYILDEILLAGELQESSKKGVLRCISQQDSLEDMEVSNWCCEVRSPVPADARRSPRSRTKSRKSCSHNLMSRHIPLGANEHFTLSPSLAVHYVRSCGDG